MKLATLRASAWIVLVVYGACLRAEQPASPPSDRPASAADAKDNAAAPAAVPKSTLRRSGSWVIEETENFCICRPASYKMESRTAAAFEKLRSELCKTWQPDAEQTAWTPKCHIVVHPGLDGYIKEVGPGGRQTIGSSLVDFDQDSISKRRIDIRGDKPNWFTEALAHEMTHIVLADRFIRLPIPHWADEGMAIQADTASKRRLHGKDLDDALSSGRAFRVVELLTMENYPHPSRMGAFYGQSASLVDYLTTRGTKAQLVDFVDRATTDGYDRALRDSYQIAGVGELERQWRKHLADGAKSNKPSNRTQQASVKSGRTAADLRDVARDDEPSRAASLAAEME